jgi:hypothetical protein
MDALDGQTVVQVIAKFGAPAEQHEYPMSEAAGEFRAGLEKYYPMPQNRDVRIQELTWESSRYFTTVWLHQINGQWFIFDSLRYGKHTQF